MDRRKRKTREAIFAAFAELLSEKHVNQITVGDIIERADVGRATFYAHFETKEFLLKAFCEELFCHVFDSLEGNTLGHSHIFDSPKGNGAAHENACSDKASVFLHLFRHLAQNDHQILHLLSCRNNELFLQYFKNGVMRLAQSQLDVLEGHKKHGLPEEFWINHVAATFVETVRFWVAHKRKETPEEIAALFLKAIG